MSYFDPDEWQPMATMSDAHREWHRNTGIPLGTPGCPQDACHDPEPYDEAEEEWIEASEHPSYWSQTDDLPDPPF